MHARRLALQTGHEKIFVDAFQGRRFDHEKVRALRQVEGERIDFARHLPVSQERALQTAALPHPEDRAGDRGRVVLVGPERR